MPRRKLGERCVGPYPHRRGWRLRIFEADGTRGSRTFPTRARAEAYKQLFSADAARGDTTVDQAIDAYERHLNQKGNKPNSIKVTLHRLKKFFPNRDLELEMLTPATCETLYKDLAATSKATDTHRNILIEARSMLRWCVDQRMLRGGNPLDKVEGIGTRQHGKEQLRLDEARLWRAKALELARAGELGAVAAMMTLRMGLRASEVTTRVVRDLDDGGRLLWIPAAKTKAGRRTLEVPDELQDFLIAATHGRKSEEPLFPSSWFNALGELVSGHHDRKWPLTWVKKICRLANVTEVTAHGMRGLYSTIESIQAVSRGVPLSDVAARMGHGSYKVTDQSYIDRHLVQQAKMRRGWEILDGGKRPQKTKRSR